MINSLKTTLFFAKTQLKRGFRDPITSIVLFGIPVLLVLIFGSITKGSSDLSIDVAIINNSQSQFAKDFHESLKKIDSFKLPEQSLSLDEAKQKMEDNELEGIVELPPTFGELRDNKPSGAVKVYFDQGDTQTGDIVASIMQSAVTEANKQLVAAPAPLSIERTALRATQATPFDNIYAIFTSMAIMMVGIFAVGSTFPTDKKSGALRLLHVTPIKAREVILGTMLSFAVVGILGVALLTLIALGLYDFQMRGSWLVFGLFIIVALTTMLGFGLAISGIAKNSTQADILGQIVFISSLAVSGVWFPRAILPDFLENLTAFMPLTPVIDGIRSITTENASLTALGPEIAILVGWSVIVYILGARMFRWS